MYGAQCHIAWPNVLIQPSPAQKAQIKSIMDLLLLWILFLLPNQGGQQQEEREGEDGGQGRGAEGQRWRRRRRLGPGGEPEGPSVEGILRPQEEGKASHSPAISPQKRSHRSFFGSP